MDTATLAIEQARLVDSGCASRDCGTDIAESIYADVSSVEMEDHMETPAQIADRIVNQENTALVEKNRAFWVARITQSISVAVATERERCAEIAEGCDQLPPGEPSTPRTIAAAIRS